MSNIGDTLYRTIHPSLVFFDSSGNPVDLADNAVEEYFTVSAVDGSGNPSILAQSTTSALASSTSFKQSVPETVLYTMDSGEGWAKADAGTGTITYDSDDFLISPESLVSTVVTGGTLISADLIGISPVIDLTGKNLLFWIKVEDPTIITDLSVRVTGDAFSTFATWNIHDDTNQFKSYSWTPITLSLTEATLTGAPNFSLINRIRIRVNASAPTAVRWGGISTIPNATTERVIFTFDDGWESVFTEAKTKMDEYNFTGTSYVIPDLVDTAGYMTLEQLNTLKTSGWDIAGHYQTNLTTLEDPGQKMYETREWLRTNGFTPSHFAFPNGGYNSRILAEARKMFTTARTINEYRETYEPADWHQLRILNVINTTPPATVTTAIDNAQTNNDLLILLFHKIVTVPSISTEYSISDFATIVDYCNTTNANVIKISEL